ncbi:D-galactonate transporter [Vibrio ishigakensis]|uniref:D-galactonate transporter n=1 Tax=Vibrio ishigakensis TaxID=1481914 RepID=A0A0B8P1B3_9VIBR|nr:D-galactonate transporter [Vibrio ishigakensis]
MSQSQVERLDLSTGKQTKKRFFIVFLLFVTVVINYLDRANLSIAAPAMMRDLDLTTEQIGWIFSAWGLSYACFQIPAGWLVDKFKPKYFLATILILWSIATVIIGFVSNFLLIIALRFIVGMFEAPSYPINSKIVTNWIPESERASSIAIYTSAQFVGLAFLAPVLSYILMTYNWQMVFIVTGGVGILWAIYWLFAYNEPKDFPGISQSELDYLKDNGALLDEQVAEKKVTDSESKTDFWGDLLYIVTRRKIIGTCIGQFALGSATIFFLTWFPTYLVEYHNLSFVKAGFMASLPFLCGFLGVLCSGFTSDYLLKKGYSLATARKILLLRVYS